MNPDRVECLSSASYGERPVAIHWEDGRLRVEAIEAQWRLPEGRRFRLRVEDGRIFQVSYLETADQWMIELIG